MPSYHLRGLIYHEKVVIFSNIANVENQRYSVDIKARKNSKTIYVSTRGRLEEVAARLGDEINS